ncbi:MAG: hypothetical protein NZM42_11885 [Gemmatales bacterium]|nr:hypothetical protein [Gemmatales bacterium]
MRAGRVGLQGHLFSSSLEQTLLGYAIRHNQPLLLEALVPLTPI